MTPEPHSQDTRVDAIAFAFAPIHKAALGVAMGLVCGALLGALTLFHLVLHPQAGPNVALLSQVPSTATTSPAPAP